MSIFKNLFGGKKDKGKSEGSNDRKNGQGASSGSLEGDGFAMWMPPEPSSFQELLEAHVGISYEKQLLLAETIRQNGWQLDMKAGQIGFGPSLRFPIQVIGSVAYASSSWMWGWANAQSGIPEPLLKHGHALKAMGERLGIDELTEGSYEVPTGFQHEMGMVAAGLIGSKSYYCADYGQGTLVVTLDGPDIPEVRLNLPGSILTRFPEIISTFELNHRNAFLHYLAGRQIAVKEEGQTIYGRRGNFLLKAEFDALGRLHQLSHEA